MRRRLEDEWLGKLCERLGVSLRPCPCFGTPTFLLAHRGADTAENHVLCEINASSVSPFPASAIAPLLEATRRALATTNAA